MLLGVPRDHHVTQMVLLHAKMCPPKLTNSRLGCQNNHSGKPESKPADLQGGPAAEAKPLNFPNYLDPILVHVVGISVNSVSQWYTLEGILAVVDARLHIPKCCAL